MGTRRDAHLRLALSLFLHVCFEIFCAAVSMQERCFFQSENQPRKKEEKHTSFRISSARSRQARSDAQLGKGPVSGDNFQTESGTS
jgi:hypothetical protein